MFSVDVYDRAFNPVHNPFAMVVEQYSALAIGGYEQAQITVEGDPAELKLLREWLRYYVVIRNQNSNPVWAGIVTEVNYPKGIKKYGFALDDMANRIAVAYSEEDADGNTVNGTTAWGDNTESQNRYGVKELLQSDGNQDEAQAIAQRDNALSAKGTPIRNIELYGGESEPVGALYCKGLWPTFSWKLFNQPGGVVRHEINGNIEHLLGWGIINSATIGFGNNGGENRIHRLLGGLDALRQDDVVIVSNASTPGNNGSFTVTEAANHDPESITSADIWFDPIDDINLTAGGLGFVQSYELIFLTVDGGVESWHNRYYWVDDETGDNHFTVEPTIIGTQVAGPSVTIQQGHSIAVSSALSDEFPGASVTLTALGAVVAQSFTLPVNTPFTVAEVYVRLKRVGNPVDGVYVNLQNDNGFGVPAGISLESVTVLGSTISDQNMTWVKFTFLNTLALSYGTTYWLTVGRTGSNSPTDYYLLDFDEDAGYTGGAMKLWNNSAWVDRAVPADMPFQIWAKRQTSDQLSDMYTAANQFCTVLDLQNATGRYSRQYRDNDQNAQQEMETLLEAGVSGGRRLIAQVSIDRALHIYQEPLYLPGIAPIFADDGSLLDATGQPGEPGLLPAGQWLTLPDETPDEAGVFIERAEYSARSGKYSQLLPKGAVDPFDVVRLT